MCSCSKQKLIILLVTQYLGIWRLIGAWVQRTNILVESATFEIADPGLLTCNFYGATMILKGSLLLSMPIVKSF